MMSNKSERRRSSRVVWRNYERELPEDLWNAIFAKIYGISGDSGEELIFKRVKGMGTFAPIPTTASRDSGLQSALSDFPEWGQLSGISPVSGTKKEGNNGVKNKGKIRFLSQT